MLACVDVDYRPDGTAVAACLGFDGWASARASAEWIARIAEPAPYVPGSLYLRELPCLLAVIVRAGVDVPRFEAIVVDAYVFLDPSGTPGLGARLFEALGRTTPVVGVAKTPYRAAITAIEVRRGASKRPLYVSAAGIEATVAAENVRAMHGGDRVPTLLRAVDRAARTR